MSEETKEMEEVVESEEVEEEAVAEAKVTKHDGEDDAKKNPNFAKDVKKAKAESKDVKEDDDEEDSDDEEGEEEEEQTKKEAREVPKLKSEILAGLVDHLKGLKKEDLSKLYGTQVIGEEEGDDEDEEEEDPEESKKVKESIDQKIEDLDV